MHETLISSSKPDSGAHLRLFCFPYAGAGTTSFNPWASLLPDVEVCLIHIPGRDKRIREPLYERLSPLVDQISTALLPYLDRPYALFGHSMGGLLSFETARALRRMQQPLPLHLFISARRAPQQPDPHRNIYRLEERDFIRLTEYLYGAMPDIVRGDPDVLRLFLTIMRADFTMLGTHQYAPEPPLDCPISVFGGLDDRSVKADALDGWREQTTAAFTRSMLPGDHTFLQSARAALINEVRQTLAPRLSLNQENSANPALISSTKHGNN